MHYHVSPKDFGETVTFNPRVPPTANSAECETPRVCFAPTIWQCLMAIEGTSSAYTAIGDCVYQAAHKGTNPTVYGTRARLTPPPKLVSDFARTGEMWSLKPIKLRRLGYLDVAQLVKGNIRMTQDPRSKLTKEFYAGWSVAGRLRVTDWAEDPPD